MADEQETQVTMDALAVSLGGEPGSEGKTPEQIAEEEAKRKHERAEQIRREKEERRRKAREEAERKAREEAERAAKEEQERKEREEAEKRRKAEEAAKAEQAAREEQERKDAAAREAAAKTKPVVKAVDMEPAAVPAVKVLPRRVSAAKVSAARARVVASIQKDVSEDLHMHTRTGRQLIGMFDEYAEMCKKINENTPEAVVSKTARKLYDIMTLCCPGPNNRNAEIYDELIKIVFNRLTRGYGTLFKDSTVFRVSYNLPSPADAMRFDAFYSAMMQLVDAAKTGSRITFNTTALGRILKSPTAIRVITNIRTRIESTRA